MKNIILPTADAEALSKALSAIMAAIAPLTMSSRRPTNAVDDPKQLLAALQQLQTIIQRAAPTATAEVTQIGSYAMSLLERAAVALQRLNDIQLQQQNGMLAVGIALWVGKHGGHIERLEPLVDTLAWLANQLTDRQQLAELSYILGALMDAVSPAISADLDNTNPGRPWRVLNINRGIVATRTHQAAIMEEAFARLRENLPQDAAAFFAQGMSEMVRLDYPQHVRSVMKRYYDAYHSPTPLH